MGDAGVRAMRMAEEVGAVVCFGTVTTGPSLVIQTHEVCFESFLVPGN